MLEAMRENLDGLSDEMKKEYVEKDGKFVLSVRKVEGLGLENVDGLKNTVEKLRASEKVLQTEVKAAEDALKTAQVDHKAFITKYDGIDADAAKDALGKIAEIKNWDGETKVKEAVQVAIQEVEQKAQIKLDEVVKQHSTTVEGLQTELKDSQGQLQEAIVTTKIVEAISKEDGNVDVLMPHVRNQVVMIKDVHGKWRPEVQNSDGGPRVNSNGTDLSIIQLVQEMKTQDTFAGCFPGVNSSGTGKTNSEESESHKKTDDVKTIDISNTKAISANLDEIASGTVKVDMGLNE